VGTKLVEADTTSNNTNANFFVRLAAAASTHHRWWQCYCADTVGFQAQKFTGFRSNKILYHGENTHRVRCRLLAASAVRIATGVTPFLSSPSST
jgi:hypothetical protein